MRYLWEECQTKRYTRQESDAVWQNAYKSVKEEYEQFKQLHSQTEDKVKKDENRHKVELLRELADRVSSGKQELSAEEMRCLIGQLKDKKYQQDYADVLAQLEKREPVRAYIIGNGRNPDAQIEYDDELKRLEYRKKYKAISILGDS